VGLGATLSLALGPVLGLELAQRYSFNAMFIVASASCLAATLISCLLPQFTLPQETRKQGEPRVWLERRAIPPAILIFIYGAGVSAVTVFLAIYCELQNMPPAANFFVVSTIGTVIARLTSGRIYDRKGHLYVIPPASLMLIASIVTILITPPKPVLYLAAVVYGLGAGGIFPSVQTLSLASVPPASRTIASAYFFVAFDSGMGLGTIFLGFVAGFFHNYSSVYVCSIIFFTLLILMYFTLFRHQLKHSES
jgi:predicted MFS family arabinose efflux permease